jgi:hypothetical protein
VSGPRSEQELRRRALRVKQVIRRRVIIGEYGNVFGHGSIEVSDRDVLNGVGK